MPRSKLCKHNHIDQHMYAFYPMHDLFIIPSPVLTKKKFSLGRRLVKISTI